MLATTDVENLWVTGSCIARRYCFTIIPDLWLVQSFCSPFCDDPLSLRRLCKFICFNYGWAFIFHLFWPDLRMYWSLSVTQRSFSVEEWELVEGSWKHHIILSIWLLHTLFLCVWVYWLHVYICIICPWSLWRWDPVTF